MFLVKYSQEYINYILLKDAFFVYFHVYKDYIHKQIYKYHIQLKIITHRLIKPIINYVHDEPFNIIYRILNTPANSKNILVKLHFNKNNKIQ